MQKLEKGQLPTKQDLKSIKGKEQDDVVLALTKAIGPDEAIKLVEGMCDQSKHAAKLAGYNGDPDGPLPKWGEPGGVEDAMKKTPGQKKKAKVREDCWDGYTKKGMKKKGKKMVPNCVKTEEVKTIKVGEDAVGSNKCHYALVMDRKVTAVGTKDEMLAKCKEEGGRVWVSTKQVGDIVEMGQMRHGNPTLTSNAGKSRVATSKPMASAGKKKKVKNSLEKKMSGLPKKKNFNPVYRRDMSEAKFAVDIEGMPRFYMDSDSPGRVKVALRQMLKKANAIKSVQRTYDPAIKADLRQRLKDASTDMKTNYVNEVLKKSDDMGKWVDDFKKSDAPQFKGKSMKKRREMAIAAKLSAMREGWMKDSGWKKTSEPRKDEYGNTIKKQNIAKHLAKKAMNKTKAMGDKK